LSPTEREALFAQKKELVRGIVRACEKSKKKKRDRTERTEQGKILRKKNREVSDGKRSLRRTSCAKKKATTVIHQRKQSSKRFLGKNGLESALKQD